MQSNPLFPHSLTHSLVDVLDSIDLDDSHLNSNQLSGTIPSTIASLTGLQLLYETYLDQ